MAAFESQRIVAMAPLTGAEKNAIEGFFRGKRGTRSLRGPVADAMAKYFVADGTTLPELPTTRPPDPANIAGWVRSLSLTKV